MRWGSRVEMVLSEEKIAKYSLPGTVVGTFLCAAGTQPLVYYGP
jgi:hypothetical protein